MLKISTDFILRYRKNRAELKKELFIFQLLQREYKTQGFLDFKQQLSFILSLPQKETQDKNKSVVAASKTSQGIYKYETIKPSYTSDSFQMILLKTIVLVSKLSKALSAYMALSNSHYTAGGFPGGASDKEHACQCRRHKGCMFNPWVRKIPWRRAW